MTRRAAGILDLPELAVFIFAFLLNLVWEFLQAPLYEGMAETAHWQGIKTCAQASVADGVIMLVGFWSTALLWRTRYWVLRPTTRQVVVFSGVGIAITIVAEYLATTQGWTWGWAYADAMPVVPIIGTGLSPLLQWVVLPPLTIWFVRRHLTSGQRRP